LRRASGMPPFLVAVVAPGGSGVLLLAVVGLVGERAETGDRVGGVSLRDLPQTRHVAKSLEEETHGLTQLLRTFLQ